MATNPTLMRLERPTVDIPNSALLWAAGVSLAGWLLVAALVYVLATVS